MTIRTPLVWLLLVVVGGGLWAGCGGRDWQGENRRLQSDLDAARRDLRQAQARITNLEGENRQMRTLLERRGVDVNTLTRELEELRRREAQQAARLDAMRAMARQFRDMVAAGQLRVRVVRGNMVVELPENILFDSGQSDLREGGQETLRRVAEILSRVQNRNFLVAGHTDNVPVTRRMTARRHYDSNWSLSALRGVAVVRFLASNGVRAEHLAAAGYADTRPVTGNDTPTGQAQNRRIEIIVMPNMDELPDLSGLEGELGQQGGGPS